MPTPGGQLPVVSIVKIKGGKTGAAVEAAIDLLGRVDAVLRGKKRIILKPNLVSDVPGATTNLQVIRSFGKRQVWERSGRTAYWRFEAWAASWPRRRKVAQ